jgi:hypothetical protein
LKVALQQFIDEFVVPLISGGRIQVRRAYSTRDREQLMADSGALGSAELRFVLLRRARELVAHPNVPDPGVEELSLWMGINNLLFLDHPETGRVWARNTRWQRVENETRVLLATALPVDMGEALARHLAVGPFAQLKREDHVITTTSGERRFVGQPVRLGLFSGVRGEQRDETVRWITQAHAPAVDRLIPEVFSVSPLSCMLEPGFAPEGWSPLSAADFVRTRAFARAICHAWAREKDWVRSGAVIAGSLLRSLGLIGPVFGLPGEIRLRDPEDPEEELPALAPGVGPEDTGAVISSLVHLHVLKVLELEARVSVGVGTRDWAVQSFLALPLLMPWLEPTTGSPFGGAEGPVRRRWEEYVEHLRGMVPRSVVENLVATLVPRIVQRASA